MTILVASEIPWKRIWNFNFAETETKTLVFLTETHINLDQIHHIINNWLGVIFFSPGDNHPDELGLEGVTEVDTDPKGRFMSFKVTPSNDRFLCFYVLSEHSTREQLSRGRFFKGLQNYMENKMREMKTK